MDGRGKEGRDLLGVWVACFFYVSEPNNNEYSNGDQPVSEARYIDQKEA